jgi:hypothetical protein
LYPHVPARITKQNSSNDHGEAVYPKPVSKELTKHGGLDDLGVTPPLGTIKTRYHDPSIAQQPLSFTKHLCSPKFMEFINLQIWTHREEKQSYF